MGTITWSQSYVKIKYPSYLKLGTCLIFIVFSLIFDFTQSNFILVKVKILVRYIHTCIKYLMQER